MDTLLAASTDDSSSCTQPRQDKTETAATCSMCASESCPSISHSWLEATAKPRVRHVFRQEVRAATYRATIARNETRTVRAALHEIRVVEPVLHPLRQVPGE